MLKLNLQVTSFSHFYLLIINGMVLLTLSVVPYHYFFFCFTPRIIYSSVSHFNKIRNNCRYGFNHYLLTEKMQEKRAKAQALPEMQ